MSKPIACQCCKHQKNALKGFNSSLIDGINIIICATCKNKGHEPRHIVVLAARSGADVTSFVRERKYCGKALEAAEVI